MHSQEFGKEGGRPRGVLVGNGMDCQPHGSEERLSPVLQRNGSKRVEAWDSCVDPPGTPSCLFLLHHQQLLQNPNMTHLDEMSGPVLTLGYEAGLKFPKGEGGMEDWLDEGSSLLFPQLPFNSIFLCPPCKYPVWEKKMCYSVSPGGDNTKRKTCTLMRRGSRWSQSLMTD